MDKSQLRRLALDFANGDVDHDGYVRERTELIDAIVAGSVPIDREVPTPQKKPRPPTSEPDPDATLEMESLPGLSAGSRLKPVHIVMGGIAIALVAAVLLGGGDEEPVPPPPPAPPLVQAPTPAAPPAVPVARQLVDDFLAENFWGASGLDRFENTWNGLNDQQRTEALSAPWFRPLTTALKQEINAQRALAGLDGGETTRAKGQRLVEFAKSLGVAGPFPSFGSSTGSRAPTAAPVSPTSTAPATPTVAPSVDSAPDTTPAPADSTSATGDDGDSTVAVAPSATGAAPSPAAPSSTTTTSSTTAPSTKAPATAPTADRPWLDSLPDDAYALQLFAVRNLDEVTRLIDANPGHDLHVIPVTTTGEPLSGEPLYRVVTGPFDDPGAARSAFAVLPDTLKRGETTPLVRKVSSLRGVPDASVPPDSTANTTAPTIAASATEPDAGQNEATGPDGYTLQLFMSQRRENVQRVVQQYPDLALRVHTDGQARETFRVLYGDFPTPGAARAAIQTLPESLLSTIDGPPLVKSSRAPAGGVVTAATRP